MIKLLFYYSEEDDPNTYEWEFDITSLLGPYTLQEVIEIVRKKFQESHKNAFTYRVQFKFGSIGFIKDGDNWSEY
jgi:hypothetical protein